MNPRPRRPNNPTPSTPSLPPDHIGLLVAAVFMIVIGFGGLYWLIFASGSLPRIGGELWLFFVLLLIAVSGLAMPIVRYLNVRFTPLDREVPPAGVIVRQSVWMGLWVVVCAWLQIPRLLTLPIAVFILLALLIIEGFLRNREWAAEREER
jgi:hypothetical protein